VTEHTKNGERNFISDFNFPVVTGCRSFCIRRFALCIRDLFTHKMYAGFLLTFIVLAVVQTKGSAFAFKASSAALFPRRSHKLFSQLCPNLFSSAAEMRDADFAMDSLVYGVLLDMGSNVNKPTINENLLPHLTQLLGTQLLDGLDYCLPILGKVEYITSFYEAFDPVVHALLEIVLHVKFELHAGGKRVVLNPVKLSNAQLAEDKQVVGNMLSFRNYTFNLTQLQTFLLTCVDLFCAVDAKMNGKSDVLQELRVKYEPEVANWETYQSAVHKNYASRLPDAAASTELSSTQ